MFGINGGELVVLLVLAFLLIGPERLPELAQQLGRLTREVKKIATGAKEKVREELGPEFDDLAALDPRQYDPRRIVREALMEDDEPVRPARPRAARRPFPAATARTGSTAAGAVAGAGAGVAAGAAAGAVAAGGAAGERAGTAAAPSAPKSAAAPEPAAASGATAARVAAVTPPAQVLAEARTAAPTATALAEEPVQPGAEEEPYVVPFDDEAT